MDSYSDSGELYHLRQQFFAAKYTDLTALDALDLEELFSTSKHENKFKAIQYQIRSLVALGKYKEALTKIESTEAPENLSVEFKALQLYTLFLQNDKAKSEEIESLVSTDSANELVNLIGGLYYTSLGDYETALQTLATSESFENISLLVYVNLLLNKTKEAAKILSNFSQISQDNIVFTLSQSWYDLTGYDESLKSAYYFYDELSSNDTTTSIKNLICLFVSNLKLLHFPESQDILNKIEELTAQGSEEQLKQWKADLLINRISFEILQGNKSDELLSELKTVDPKGEYLTDLNEKNQLFDSIVEKYAV